MNETLIIFPTSVICTLLHNKIIIYSSLNISAVTSLLSVIPIVILLISELGFFLLH